MSARFMGGPFVDRLERRQAAMSYMGGTMGGQWRGKRRETLEGETRGEAVSEPGCDVRWSGALW